MSEFLEKLSFESKGKITKTADGKFSFEIELNILPMDDLLTAQGPKFETAQDAAMKLASVYGQKLHDLLMKYEP